MLYTVLKGKIKLTDFNFPKLQKVYISFHKWNAEYYIPSNKYIMYVYLINDYYARCFILKPYNNIN